uniref:protein-ribulosamine 3-kinase n=1 Tax=Geospiza parvula TaxID=87175 RepID=A0A8C3Q821_GEOPR
MGDALKRAGGTAVLRQTGPSGGGCISPGRSCDTGCGRGFARSSCQGEAVFEKWQAILKTQTVRVPKPIKTVELPGDNTVLVMEHLEMKSLQGHSALLGTQLADLPLHNQQLREKMKKEGSTVGKGQGLCDPQKVYLKKKQICLLCGIELTSAVMVLQVNNWHSDWVNFFARQRIQPQMDLTERSSGDREARELWAQLQCQTMTPSLFCAEDDSSLIIFDPASFCGHSDFDLAIDGMFGGFSSSFYSAYHSKIPRATGFEKQLKLYQLFHYMNHWNHFGSGYRGSPVNIMRNLVK